ncbi:hypothetical protein EDB84DRAFT_1443795 [Lactarius hengduanensis]|nr:hypothetical protein EDB84DRAFT_1443795 [Lactarius hengduanensis]
MKECSVASCSAVHRGRVFVGEWRPSRWGDCVNTSALTRNLVHALSGILGQAVVHLFIPFQFPGPLQPAKAIFVGVDVLITAAKGVSSAYDALVDLFECIGNFLKRLRIYTDTPLTPFMMNIVAKIMAELLSVLALATKHINQEKFAKKLLGDRDIETVLRKLDHLTQEEGRRTMHGPDTRRGLRTC